MGRRVVGGRTDPIVTLRLILHCAAFVVLAMHRVNILADPILYPALIAMSKRRDRSTIYRN
jgi:hypothetical protein